ncbi:Presenilin-domain-containing protein, partial [Rozella allomycis CSF55]
MDNTSTQRLEIEARDNTDPEKDYKENLRFFCIQVKNLFKPLLITFCLVSWFSLTTIDEKSSNLSPTLVYKQSSGDSTSTILGGSLINALIVLGSIVGMTLLFVLCYVLKLYKVRIFNYLEQLIYAWLGLSTSMILGGTGGLTFYGIIRYYNIAMDYLTFFFCLWNFVAVGLLCIYYHAPLYIQQSYLVVVSALLATNMARLPEWTAWCVVSVVSIYDLFAVLCPKGPLKMLITTAEERNEALPGLLYSVGMADTSKSMKASPGVYQVQVGIDDLENKNSFEIVDNITSPEVETDDT